MSTEDDKFYLCTVQQVVLKGEHGPYAVATCDSGEVKGYITFSCKKPVWTKKFMPRATDKVLLYEVHKTSRGWRSERAVPQTPSSPPIPAHVLKGGSESKED